MSYSTPLSSALRMVALAGLLSLGGVGLLRAHHGAEFAALEGFDLGHAGDGYLLAGIDLERFDTFDELSLELSLFFVPVDRIGVGVDVRYAESPTGDWAFSSVTPKVQLQLTDPHSKSRFKFGLSIGYQFAEDLRRTRTFTTVDEQVRYREIPNSGTTVAQEAAVETDVGAGGPACNPLFDLDCPVATGKNKAGGRALSPIRAKHGGTHGTATSTSSSASVTTSAGGGVRREKVVTRTETTTTEVDGGHSGIHNHDADMWVGRLTMQTHLGKTQVVANLIATYPESDHAYWGYGVGARRQVWSQLSIGAEVIGDLASNGEHEAIGSLIYDFNEHTMLRLSAGVGLSDESANETVRAGLLWRF